VQNFEYWVDVVSTLFLLITIFRSGIWAKPEENPKEKIEKESFVGCKKKKVALSKRQPF